MKFQTVCIIKHKVDVVWKAMRDDLARLAPLLEDIKSVTEQERRETGKVHTVVNVWKAAPKLPQAVVQFLNSEMFVWTDRAQWNDETHLCDWVIEPHHFRDSVTCRGTTAFEPAMGGGGTKVTFSGDLEWNSQKLLGAAGVLGNVALSGAEGIIRGVIQKNFRKIADAVVKSLGGEK